MIPPDINPDIIALGIQQPWAELILRGIKTLEIRTMGTQVRGPIYLYASRTPSPYDWAWEFAAQHGFRKHEVSLGQVVGQVNIHNARPGIESDALSACVPAKLIVGKQAWELHSPVRFKNPVAPAFLPYGMWFYPWKRRSGE